MNGIQQHLEETESSLRHQQQIARTASMPASTLPYHLRQGVPARSSPTPHSTAATHYGQESRQCESPHYGHLAAPHIPPKSPVPPPAPKTPAENLNSPRSPNARGQRLSYELVPVNFPDNLLDGSADSSNGGSDQQDRMMYSSYSARTDIDKYNPMSRSYNEAELQRTLLNMSASRDYNSNERKVDAQKSQTPPAVSEKPTRPPRSIESQRGATPKTEAVGTTFNFPPSSRDGVTDNPGRQLAQQQRPLTDHSLKPIALGNQYKLENSRSGQLW